MWKYLIPWEVIHHCEVWLGDPLGRFPHLGYLTQITWVTASKNFIGSWIWQFHWSHTSMPVDKELRVTSSVCYRLANKFYGVLWLVHERLDVGSRRSEQFSLLALQRSENHQQIKWQWTSWGQRLCLIKYFIPGINPVVGTLQVLSKYSFNGGTEILWKGYCCYWPVTKSYLTLLWPHRL